MEWRLADAENRFSELVSRALSEGPQRVTRRDDVVIVIAEHEYEQLTDAKLSFKEFLLQDGPTLEDRDLECDRFPVN
ncbi:MAG: type II toxin-antitoxin system Phd/YefM family antitoxin [Cyanobacteria bacterium J06636_16]